MDAAVQGKVIQIGNIRTKWGKFLTKAAVADESGAIEVIWFNQPYLTQTLKEGMTVSLAGKVENFGKRVSLVSPEFEVLEEGAAPTHTAGLVPVYPETARLTSKWIRSRIRSLLDSVEIKEFIPEEILRERQLPPLRESLEKIHFPKKISDQDQARRRFALEELFLFNLRSLKQRSTWKKQKTPLKISYEKYQSAVAEFIGKLPFGLTGAQQRVLAEILKDLTGEKPMNRLLQGDVGSGKTVVAAIAAYLIHLNGAKTVFMAPTEILADQHFQTLSALLSPSGIKVALHTGSQKPKEDCDLWVGTHALFYKRGSFQKVGLVVIDEQHRFGVEQRAQLLQKTEAAEIPHLLTLTATPIPRTLALTVYGDLDLSILDELPPGRKRIKTFVVPAQKREDGYRWIHRRVQEGDQAFVICPLIEESTAESMQQVKAVTAEFEKLTKLMPDVRIELLHGRMPAKDKALVMQAFKSGTVQILVSTPVVEVGIDIPNASIMVVEAAERFGLASLHQLRGRVGRGEKESYCFLFAEKESPETSRRLQALADNESGFQLAELDLKLRGPGEIYGVKQHGLTELKVADLTDTRLLKDAQKAAGSVFQEDLSLERYPDLEKELQRFSTSLIEPN
jgi:ATP-dependent DNA helicase RecG